MEGTRDQTSERNFILSQGFPDPPPAACAAQFSGLMWQPRVTLLVLLVGVVTRRWEIFAAVAAFHWWCALVPRWNPFEAAYNSFFATGGKPPILPAPPPRRFALAMSGTMSLAIAFALYSGWQKTSWVLEGMLVLAMTAQSFFRFCLGSYMFFLLTGKIRFANSTLPWSRSAAR